MVTQNAAWSGERVPQRAVMDHWLAAEHRKQPAAQPDAEPVGMSDDPRTGSPEESRADGSGGGRAAPSKWGVSPADTEGATIEETLAALDDDEALDALLQRKPGAAAFLWRAKPIEWSRIRMDHAEFERLRYVEGPEHLGWRALAPNGRVVAGARRIAAGDRGALAVETGVDVERVCAMAETLANGEDLDALVLATRRGQGAPAVADGNHRATAIALHALRTGEYSPQRAYLGVGTNPVLEPLRERVRGVLSRLRPGGRRDEPRW